jgi:hypothetical protein
VPKLSSRLRPRGRTRPTWAARRSGSESYVVVEVIMHGT